jgi:DNA primase
MSLPPGFLDELKTRVSLAQVAGRKVVWDRRKSNQGKGDMWAPCPFHQEKTASFHVDDRKGFFYCFGCHAKGDVVGFVQETENIGFMEAVEMLAREAGMTMPARDPKAAEKADRMSELAKATEAAVGYFRLQLKTQGAAEARAYLQEKRGLSPETLERFEIGYAPGGRNATLQALTGKGIPERDVIEAGIATKPDDGGAPYDAFRDRIVFPIRDPRGRCIGFGGRAMDPNARAKYLNSRETPLFDKGRALYNHGPARAAAGKGQTLIVAEGYMDVVALVAAGFEAALAPLGTAITEEQLQMLWRIAEEPVIALDGDKAGLRAAMRLVDLALPHLGPNRSLRFCILPEGQDPDDLIRAKGPQAMQEAIDAAEPLVKLLWRRETEGHVFDTPERRAGLDTRLRAAVARIKDQSLRRHYGEALAEMRRELFRPHRQRPQGKRSKWHKRGFYEAPVAPLAATRTLAGKLEGERLRCALILATLCRYPSLIDEFDDRLDRLDPRDEAVARLAWFLVCTPERDRDRLREGVSQAGHIETLESLEATGHLRITPFLSSRDDPDAARDCLEEEFAKHAAARALEEELNEAAHDLAEAAMEEDSTLSFRLRQAVRGKHAALSPRDDGPLEQFGDTPEARAAFHELLNSAGQAKKN